MMAMVIHRQAKSLRMVFLPFGVHGRGRGRLVWPMHDHRRTGPGKHRGPDHDDWREHGPAGPASGGGGRSDSRPRPRGSRMTVRPACGPRAGPELVPELRWHLTALPCLATGAWSSPGPRAHRCAAPTSGPYGTRPAWPLALRACTFTT